MENKILIFPNATEFIKVLEQLSKQYEPKPLFKLNKHISTFAELEKEIYFLNKCSIDVFTGFKRDKLIKVCATGSDGVVYHIVYSFNSSKGSGTIYDKLNRYLRKRDKIMMV